MVPGFNHNVKHKGQLFHIQTEDSGIDNPHIITHLFVGGNILASKKTSYADIIKADKLEEVVTELMKEQHKEMLRKLVHGDFDSVVDQMSHVKAYTLDGPAPLNVEPGAAAPSADAMAAVQGAAPVVPQEVADARKLEVVPKAPDAATAAETIFGEDLISEKSLDEVILSYLAEDVLGDS
jgi:hypothetical protein